jgi:hypothetical protein
LLEVARIDERVLVYEQAQLTGDRLRVAYRVSLYDRNGRERSVARRAAVLQLADLRAEPAFAVEALPVEPVRADAVSSHGESVPIVPAAEAKPVSAPRLVVRSEGGRHTGFDLLSPGAPRARLESGALHRSRYAYWVYPLLPMTAALDLLLLVPELCASPPLFLVNE